MSDSNEIVEELFGRSPHLAKSSNRHAPERAKEQNKSQDGEEESCRAFGYLRGLHERAEAVRFCFRDGNSLCLAYSWLGAWQHNPSVGLLAKFTGDVVTLVLIRGSNLDMPVIGTEINLTDRGLQRYRITYVREMDEDELAHV